MNIQKTLYKTTLNKVRKPLRKNLLLPALCSGILFIGYTTTANSEVQIGEKTARKCAIISNQIVQARWLASVAGAAALTALAEEHDLDEASARLDEQLDLILEERGLYQDLDDLECTM